MKFVCMSRDYRDGKIYLVEFDAEDKDDAWRIIEEEIATNTTDEWLFTEQSWNDFLEQVKTFGGAHEERIARG